MKLTDTGIKALLVKPKGQKTYWDDMLKGFGCRVSQGGTKSFVVQHGADRRLITIGRYPVITLADARTEAKRILAELTLGRHRPRTVRWDEALERYLAACEEKNRKRTVHAYKRLLNRHFPFKRQQLSDITPEDIERRVSNIKAPGERSHALVAVKVFLGWCQKPPRRYIPHNPCEGMAPTKRKARRRILTDAELTAVFQTAMAGTDTFSPIVALLILTGQRRNEIASLRRSWCNKAQRLITFPESITKNKVEHAFPYGAMVEHVLNRPSLSDSDLFFPPYRSHVRGIPTTTYAGCGKDKQRFDRACGVVGWTLHDLRRTFATRVAELGVLPHVVERLLNHRLGAISNQTQSIVTELAEIYNLATFLPQMREAIQVWENKLTTLLRLSEAA
jgi:integrase